MTTTNTTAVNCQQCGGPMKKTKRAEHNRLKQMFAILFFLFGFVLLFFYPVGTIMGVIIMFFCLGIGYKKVKVWQCQNCGYFFERAK